jgi:hypothetical protein
MGLMKNRVFDSGNVDSDEVVATFGEAQLVRLHDRLQLRGGSMAERAEALEWIALFMPGEVVTLER